MSTASARSLVVAGAFSAAAALAHLVCIVIGAPAYRFMGAGEGMARAAEAGQLAPTLMTASIAAVLAVWALYAFSGAGLIARLPLLKWVLLAIAGVLLARAFAFPLLMSRFPENSMTFWWVSSGICLLMGVLYLYGLIALWRSR